MTATDPGAFPRLDPLTELLKPFDGVLRDAKRQPDRNAARAEETRQALVARIASGQSKIKFDFSNRTISPARANEKSAQEVLQRNEELRKQYTAYLEELSRTPTGMRLLTELDRSKHPTTIVFDYEVGSRTSSKGEHATDKKGEPATVSLNPGQAKYDHRDTPPPAWTTERQKYGFYHELVHAWHISNGTQATGSHKQTPNSEWQATGLGPWAKDPISDNAIRREMGKAERPEYGSVPY